LSEESAILGFPAVLLRTSTERPEVLDKGTIIIGGIRDKDIMQAMDLTLSIKENSLLAVPVPDYSDINVSLKVVKIIQSYTEIVNKFIWGK
jgi:UDP-N-acetylglucosamine 2-epimerase (non-hydrolysing)